MALKMRDSGVEWIGEVPEGWEIKPLKSIVSCNDSVLSEETPGGYEFDYIDIGSVKYGVGIVEKERMRFSDAPSRARRVVEKGDVIVSTVRTYLKSIASIPDFKTPLIASTGFAVLRGRDVYPSFLNFALLSQLFVDEVEARSVGISYPAINATELIAIKVVVPPLPEQRRIAEYLDEKCAAIDGAVDELKRGIEDCKAWKKAIIFEAVTGKKRVTGNGERGMGRMRESGIPWIGEIPEGWEVSRVKYICKIQNGQDPKTTGDIPVYGSGETSFKTCGEYKEGPAVLLGRKGATLHIPHYIESRYWNVDTAFDVHMKGSHCLKWFYYLAGCFDYRQYISQTTLPGMTQTNYNNMSIPLPSRLEQQAIADYLDEKCAAIDALVAEKGKLIADLEAYKKSLIFELVTGKREVA